MTALSTVQQSLNVGGLAVDVFSMRWQPGPAHENASSLSIASSGPPILALIVLHGRTETKEASGRIAEHTLRYVHDRMRSAADRDGMRELIVVTMVCLQRIKQ